MKKVYLVGAERSPIAFVPYPKNGKSTSSISTLRPEELGAQVRDQLVEKSGLPLEHVDVFRLGSLLNQKIEPSLFHAPAKTVIRTAGSGRICHINALTFEGACATGLIAIEDVVEGIQLDRVQLGLVMGLDMLSHADKQDIDAVIINPETGKTMAEQADQKARKLGMTREELDEYTYQSYQLADLHKNDHSSRLVPIYLPNAQEPVLAHDEGSKRALPFAVIKRLPTLPKCELLTKAHASKLGDAAACVALASPEALTEYGLRPLARILSVESYSEKVPEDFIIASNEAISLALSKAGLSVEDMDLFVINETFAPAPVYFMKKSGVPREKVNGWGGVIPFGHPWGATGVALLVMALTMLEKEHKRLGVVATCAAGGEASACVIERLSFWGRFGMRCQNIIQLVCH